VFVQMFRISGAGLGLGNLSLGESVHLWSVNEHLHTESLIFCWSILSVDRINSRL